MGIKNSKIRVLPYEEESFYIGETKSKKTNKIPNGKGKFTDLCGNIYIGDFENNQFNGNGTIHYNIVDFLDDDGEIMEEFSGEYLAYEGEWKNNVKHGKGELTFLDGTTYIGDFQFDEIHGNGKIFYQNGDYYIGEFKLGLQHGKGCLYNCNDEKLYDGQWINNCFHGKGTYFYTNGIVRYQGNWFQSLAHGIGILYNDDKSIKFYGLFEKGKEKESYLKESCKDKDKPFTDVHLETIQKSSSGKNTIVKALKTPDMESMKPSSMIEELMKNDTLVLDNPIINVNPIHNINTNNNVDKENNIIVEKVKTPEMNSVSIETTDEKILNISRENIKQTIKPSAPPKRPPVKPIRIPSSENNKKSSIEPVSYNYNPSKNKTPTSNPRRNSIISSPKHNIVKNPLLSATNNNFISNKNIFNKNNQDKSSFNPLMTVSPTNKMFRAKRDELIAAMGGNKKILAKQKRDSTTNSKFKLSDYMPKFNTQFQSNKNIQSVKSVNPLHDLTTKTGNSKKLASMIAS